MSRYLIINEVIWMTGKIEISRKTEKKGEDGYKIVSVRMKEELIDRLDTLSAQTNRSRNELINLLLKKAISIVSVEE